MNVESDMKIIMNGLEMGLYEGSLEIGYNKKGKKGKKRNYPEVCFFEVILHL